MGDWSFFTGNSSQRENGTVMGNVNEPAIQDQMYCNHRITFTDKDNQFKDRGNPTDLLLPTPFKSGLFLLC